MKVGKTGTRLYINIFISGKNKPVTINTCLQSVILSCLLRKNVKGKTSFTDFKLTYQIVIKL